MEYSIAKYLEKDISDCIKRLPSFDRNVRSQDLQGKDKDLRLLESAMSQTFLTSHILSAVDPTAYKNILNSYEKHIQTIKEKYGSDLELTDLSEKIITLHDASSGKASQKLQEKLAKIDHSELKSLKDTVGKFAKATESLYKQDEPFLAEIISDKLAQCYSASPEHQQYFKRDINKIRQLWDPAENYKGELGNHLHAPNVTVTLEPLRSFLKDIVGLHQKQDPEALSSKLKNIILNPQNKEIIHYIAKDHPKTLQNALHKLSNEELLKANSIYSNNPNIKEEIAERTDFINALVKTIINFDITYLKEAMSLRDKIDRKIENLKRSECKRSNDIKHPTSLALKNEKLINKQSGINRF